MIYSTQMLNEDAQRRCYTKHTCVQCTISNRMIRVIDKSIVMGLNVA